MQTTRIDGKGIYIRPLTVTDAEELLALRIRNRQFMSPFEPVLSDDHFTLQVQQELIVKGITEQELDQSYTFGIFAQSQASKESAAVNAMGDEVPAAGPLVGRIRLSAVFRGPWQNANLGYYVDEACNGQGYASEAASLVLHAAFETLQLHRVQAAVMPWNIGSNRVMEKAGFRKEGFAKHYLKINGSWEDHFIYAVTLEDWMERKAGRQNEPKREA